MIGFGNHSVRIETTIFGGRFNLILICISSQLNEWPSQENCQVMDRSQLNVGNSHPTPDEPSTSQSVSSLKIVGNNVQVTCNQNQFFIKNAFHFPWQR